jgi:hypothetical protein
MSVCKFACTEGCSAACLLDAAAAVAAICSVNPAAPLYKRALKSQSSSPIFKCLSAAAAVACRMSRPRNSKRSPSPMSSPQLPPCADDSSEQIEKMTVEKQTLNQLPGPRTKGKPPLPPPSPVPPPLQKAAAVGGGVASSKSKRNREPGVTGGSGPDEMADPEGGEGVGSLGDASAVNPPPHPKRNRKVS